MSETLAKANKYMRDPVVRERSVRRSVASSSAIEGIRTPRSIVSAKESVELRRAFREARAETRLLEHEWASLLKDHEDEWVAVHGKEFLFNKDLKRLIKAADKKGWPLGTIVVDRLTARRPAVLL